MSIVDDPNNVGIEVTQGRQEKTSCIVGIIGQAIIWSWTRAMSMPIATKAHAMKNLSHYARYSVAILLASNKALNSTLIKDIWPTKSMTNIHTLFVVN